jgi:hypothetical protein
MERRSKRRVSAGGSHPADAAGAIHDRYWAREVRGAVAWGVLLFGMLALLDLAQGRLSAERAGWWAGLAVLLSIILTPPRVSAENSGLDSRGFLHHQRVRTDCLVAVRVSEGVAQRLVLKDTSGGRLVLDPRVLVANPLLWHQLDQGARRSLEQGTLLCGGPLLERLGQRIEGEVYRGILRTSGME